MFTLDLAPVQCTHWFAPQPRQIDAMVTNDIPEEKRLQHASFVVHATRGVIRDQKTRRRVMVAVLTTAVVLMIAGVTFLKATLDPHQHPGWFIFFWLICAWLTIAAILLAAFDLLMLTSDARKTQRELRDSIERRRGSSSTSAQP